MKAITLQQPWASLVACGAKRIETRSWSTRHRGIVALASSKKQCRTGADLRKHPAVIAALGDTELPYGSIIATFHIYDCLPMEAHICLPGVFDEYPELDNETERLFGDFNTFDPRSNRRRWAFVLDEVRPLPSPIPVRGGLGLWDWPIDMSVQARGDFK